MSSIGNVKIQNSITLDSTKVRNIQDSVKTEKAVTLSSDNVQVKREMRTGFVQGLKGAGAGLSGLAAGVGIGALMSGGGRHLSTGATIGGAATILPSIAAGVVVSQTTDKAGWGALIGAGTGALVGTVQGAIVSKNISGSLLVGTIGAVTGAIAGSTASLISQRK